MPELVTGVCSIHGVVMDVLNGNNYECPRCLGITNSGGGQL